MSEELATAILGDGIRINSSDLYLSQCGCCERETLGFGGACFECDRDEVAERLVDSRGDQDL